MFNITGGFKRKKPRQFTYKPLYYDPAEEEKERRDSLRGVNEKEYKPGSLVRGMRMERYTKPTGMNSRMERNDARNRTIFRLIIFLFLLVLVGYIIMNSSMLEQLFTVFSN